jgi:hypothetical protein
MRVDQKQCNPHWVGRFSNIARHTCVLVPCAGHMVPWHYHIDASGRRGAYSEGLGAVRSVARGPQVQRFSTFHHNAWGQCKTGGVYELPVVVVNNAPHLHGACQLCNECSTCMRANVLYTGSARIYQVQPCMCQQDEEKRNACIRGGASTHG